MNREIMPHSIVVGQDEQKHGGFITKRVYIKGENPGGRVIQGLTGTETILEYQSVRPVVVVKVSEK